VFGLLNFTKFQAPKPKSQINSKNQIQYSKPMIQRQLHPTQLRIDFDRPSNAIYPMLMFWSLVIGICDLPALLNSPVRN
jgi:hypothetical protein